MTPEIINLIQACAWAPSQFLIFSANVYANLIYYSHLGAIIPVILIVLLVFIYGRKEFPNILLVITAFFFSLWVFSDLVLWATEFPAYTMFFWALEIISEPLVYFFSFYFFYTYVFKRDFSTFKKILFSIPLLPTLVFASTRLGLLGYDISNCDRAAVEGVLATYGYAVEILYTLLIIVFAVYALKKASDAISRRKVVLLSLGIVLFLLSFSIGNILEVFSLDWGIGQYGLFGAPVFVAFLAYLIVQYKAFNVRLMGAQALVAGLWLSVMSLLFIRNISDVRTVTAVTLIFVLVAGILLVRGVKREIASREHIEKLAQNLETANKGQENLIHIINHQIKGYLATARNIFAELSQSTDYGQMPEASLPLLTKGFEEMGEGVDYVQGILKSNSAQSGTLSYDMKPVDLKAIISNLVSKQKVDAEQAGLSFESNIADDDYSVIGDAIMLEEMFKNLITNAIRYNNPNGSIAVTLSHPDNKILFTVKDTGLGITEEDQKKLYTSGGMGKDSMKHNANASGYGLAFVKPVVEKHQGKIWYETEVGKGTTFFVELPIEQTT